MKKAVWKSNIDLKKVNVILIFGIAIIAILYVGRSLFVPFTFGIFLATLVRPISDRLEKLGTNRLISSLLSTFIVFVVISGLTVLLVYQLRILLDDFPELEEKFFDYVEELQKMIASITGASPEEQNVFFERREESFRSDLEDFLTSALGGTFSSLFHFFLIHVYLFLFLLYRKKFSNFMMMYLSPEKKEKGREVINKASHVAHYYLLGRIQVMTILAIMYIIIFLIFDVRYVLLLTVFGALVTVIPYLGPLISGALPILIFLVTEDNMTLVLLFALSVFIVQMIESYVLEPLIMGSEVNLSPLIIIIAIIIGQMVWGVSGMILFVPIFAIVKIIFDQIEALHPIGYLLGSRDKPEQYQQQHDHE